MMDEYLAGQFDAEGYVNIHGGNRRLPAIAFGLGTTDHRIPQLFKRRFGGHIYSRRMANHTIYEWRLTGGQAVPFIDTLLPLLITKRSMLRLARGIAEQMSAPRYWAPRRPAPRAFTRKRIRLALAISRLQRYRGYKNPPPWRARAEQRARW